ncbi:DUF4383 domain-containing protein [Nocardioides antri]|uniref:DUF4383 domain-containing protein n=1 Tax=Nocardioides antri TaxID=2607659 RepID=A0A5B1M9S4_9ACTN|nr:DUF4383 domain-containing protein [Nocardioides antri]KAA1429328.1 DUF4383 domain-containing protein [Nocardioides antri]
MSTTSRTSITASPLQTMAAVVAAVFLLVGVAGFVPGLTTNVDDLEFAGHKSSAELLGVFQVSILHNIVHLLFGIAGLVMARTWSGARAFLIGGGAIYALLFVYGLVVDHKSDANFVPLNDADNWLHLVLAIGMLAIGLALGNRRTTDVGGRRTTTTT